MRPRKVRRPFPVRLFLWGLFPLFGAVLFASWHYLCLMAMWEGIFYLAIVALWSFTRLRKRAGRRSR